MQINWTNSPFLLLFYFIFPWQSDIKYFNSICTHIFDENHTGFLWRHIINWKSNVFCVEPVLGISIDSLFHDWMSFCIQLRATVIHVWNWAKLILSLGRFWWFAELEFYNFNIVKSKQLSTMLNKCATKHTRQQL